MTSLMISQFPQGTLSANIIIPAVDTTTPPGSDVQFNLQSLLGTKLTLSGTAQTTIALSPSDFSITNGTLSVTYPSGGSGITLNGTAVTALDPNTFTLTGGVASVTETNFASLTAATSLTSATQIMVVAGGTAYTCTLQQLATEIIALTAPAISVSSIAAQYVGNPFTITGTLTNYNSAPTLMYQDNSGSYNTITGTITTSAFSFTHPALSAGTYTVGVEDENGTHATSDSFTVAYASATAATLANVPASVVVNTAITGVTATLTPAYAQAYAVLNTGGTDVGTRQAFTGTDVPSLTPTTAGSYLIAIYAAATGGTALVTSSTITVTNVVATGATISGAPATATTGNPISGVTATLTPSSATAYAVLNNGSDIGSRVAFTGTVVPTFTPSATGTDTIKIYAAATGGTALATSSNIVVSAPASAPSIGSGVAPVLALDASKASSVYADTGLTTEQTTNGGTVAGWKDTSGNAYNFLSSNGSGTASLVTNSTNGLNGIFFPSGSPVVLGLTSTQAQALGNAFNSATTGVTVAYVFQTSNVAAGSVFQLADSGYSNNIESGPYASSLRGVGPQPPFESFNANTVYCVVCTFDPVALVSKISVNNIAAISNTCANNYSGVTFAHAFVGNSSGGTTGGANTLYEVDVWPTLASGTGGASPSGDIATILTYLQNKWA